MFSKFAKLHWNSQCKSVFVIRKRHNEEKKILVQTLNLYNVSKSREASCESLLLTGTPSVCNLKFQMQIWRVLEIPVTANRCEF